MKTPPPAIQDRRPVSLVPARRRGVAFVGRQRRQASSRARTVFSGSPASCKRRFVSAYFSTMLALRTAVGYFRRRACWRRCRPPYSLHAEEPTDTRGRKTGHIQPDLTRLLCQLRPFSKPPTWPSRKRRPCIQQASCWFATPWKQGAAACAACLPLAGHERARWFVALCVFFPGQPRHAPLYRLPGVFRPSQGFRQPRRPLRDLPPVPGECGCTHLRTPYPSE